jgi:hypothetical protein
MVRGSVIAPIRRRKRSMKPTICFTAAVLAFAGSASATTVVINFDELAVNSTYAGNTYAGLGVTMTQVDSSPDALLNALLTINTVSTNFLTYGPNGATSGDVYAYASGGNDMLFSFSSQVSLVSLVLDDYTPETGDIVRLAALVYNSITNEYLVIDSTQDLDHPGNSGAPASITLTVAPGQYFVHALFQSTTEQEGFDNLTFHVIPLPTASLMGIAGLSGLALRRRRHAAC